MIGMKDVCASMRQGIERRCWKQERKNRRESFGLFIAEIDAKTMAFLSQLPSNR